MLKQEVLAPGQKPENVTNTGGKSIHHTRKDSQYDPACLPLLCLTLKVPTSSPDIPGLVQDPSRQDRGTGKNDSVNSHPLYNIWCRPTGSGQHYSPWEG